MQNNRLSLCCPRAVACSDCFVVWVAFLLEQRSWYVKLTIRKVHKLWTTSSTVKVSETEVNTCVTTNYEQFTSETIPDRETDSWLHRTRRRRYVSGVSTSHGGRFGHLLNAFRGSCMKMWCSNLLGSGGRLATVVTPPGRSEWYSRSRQRNQTILAWIIGVSKCTHIQLTIVALNRCSYRSVKGLINQSTTREVGPSGEDSNEYNSCFSLPSLRLPRRANLATRLFVRQSSRRRRDRRLSLSDWRRAFTEPDPMFADRFWSFALVARRYYASVATMTWDANSSWNMSDAMVDYQLERSCELYSFIIYTVFVGTLVVVGVIGNIFALVVFWKESITSSALFLFQCLSLIDSALLLYVFPMYAMHSFVVYTGWLQGYWAIHPYTIVYVLLLALTAQTATIWVTVLVAFTRYIAICLPFRASRLCTVSKVKKQLTFVLLSAVLFNMPKFMEYRVKYVTYDNGTTYSAAAAAAAYSRLLSHKLYYKVYDNILYFIFNLALPVFVLMLLNIRMIKALKAFRRTRLEMQSVRQQQDNNITFVLIIVVIVFIICQVPALINQVMWNVAPDEARQCGGFHFYLRHIANMLVIFNSAINFVIYILFNKRFRLVLIQTACCRAT